MMRVVIIVGGTGPHDQGGQDHDKLFIAAKIIIVIDLSSLTSASVILPLYNNQLAEAIIG